MTDRNAPDRLVGLTVRVTPDLRKRLRIAAASEDREIQAIVAEAVEDYLRTRAS
jgi:predicted transcriptional regulator